MSTCTYLPLNFYFTCDVLTFICMVNGLDECHYVVLYESYPILYICHVQSVMFMCLICIDEMWYVIYYIIVYCLRFSAYVCIYHTSYENAKLNNLFYSGDKS